MAGYIFKKKSHGKIYYYAGESKRVGKTSKRIWEIYLGTFDKIVRTMSEGILLPDETSSTPYGIYSAFVEIAGEIDFVNIVNSLFPKRNQGLSIGEYFLFGILARLSKPATVNSIQDWYKSKNIDKIYLIDPKFLTAQNYWNNMDSLDLEKVNELHHLLLKSINKDNSIQTSYIYFDPTNFHTFIKTSNEKSTIPKTGNSKAKRYELRQVNLALAVTKEDGIPVYHKTYPGNINDVTFFKENLDSFIKHIKKNSPNRDIVVVFDKGNNCMEIFEKLCGFKKPKIKFIGSLRPSTQEEIFSIPVKQLRDSFTTDAGNVVQYKEIRVNAYERRFRGVLTYDENTYRKKQNTWTTNMNKILREIITFLENKLNVKKWREKEAVEIKLKEMVSKKKMKDVICFQVNGDYGHLWVSLYCDIEAAKKMMNCWGKTLIFTSCEKVDIEEIIKGYRLKNNIEECFKMLNNTYLLSVRPINHWTDQMIKAHMATCVFGLELIQIIRKRLRDADIKMSINEVFERLMEIPLVRLYYKNKKTVFKVGSMDKKTRRIAEVLGVRLRV